MTQTVNRISTGQRRQSAPELALRSGLDDGSLSEIEIAWSAQDLKVTEVTAKTSDRKLGACVEKSLRGASSLMEATCTAIVVVDDARTQ